MAGDYVESCEIDASHQLQVCNGIVLKYFCVTNEEQKLYGYGVFQTNLLLAT